MCEYAVIPFLFAGGSLIVVSVLVSLSLFLNSMKNNSAADFALSGVLLVIAGIVCATL